jgi:hypothetical protein
MYVLQGIVKQWLDLACFVTQNAPFLNHANFIKAPTDILFDVLLCRCRYKMSYRVNSQEGERCLEHLN